MKIAKPVYEVSADILVNEDEKKGGGGLSSLMGDIAGGGFSLDGMIGGGSVNDEILVISSHSLIREMVQRLDLNISYTSKKNFFKKKEYYRNSPLCLFDSLIFNEMPLAFLSDKSISSLFSNISASPSYPLT